MVAGADLRHWLASHGINRQLSSRLGAAARTRTDLAHQPAHSAHQSNPGTPGPWCRGVVGLVEPINEFAHAGRVAQAASHHLHHPELYADMTLCFWMLLQVGCHGGKSLIWVGWQIFQRAVFAPLNMF